MLRPSVLAMLLGLVACTPEEVSDRAFPEAAMQAISACLASGRDCGSYADVKRGAQLRDDCFANVTRMEMDVDQSTAILLVSCTSGGMDLTLTARGDRRTTARYITEPVAFLLAGSFSLDNLPD